MSDKKIVPLFIFSLPRSGSTLLQRMLMSHTKISGIAEPWLLLPFAYCLKSQGIKTEYGHASAVKFINHLMENLPNGSDDYYNAVRNMALSLYSKLSAPESTYFLDKTPRYFYIIPFISRIFPEGKFIFLLRNPIGIASSYIKAFNKNSLKRFDHFERDLLKGPALISNGYSELKDKSILIRYEELVASPETILRKVFDYLELDFEVEILNSFNKIKLGGLAGTLEYPEDILINNDRWKKIVTTSHRKKYFVNVIKNFSEQYLNLGEYRVKDILEAIGKCRSKFSLQEFFYYHEARIIRHIKRIIKWDSYS